MSTGPHATVVDIQADIKDTAAESMGQTGSGKLEPKQDILLQEKHAGQFEGGCLAWPASLLRSSFPDTHQLLSLCRMPAGTCRECTG